MSLTYGVFIKITFTFILFTNMAAIEEKYFLFFDNFLYFQHLYAVLNEVKYVTRYAALWGYVETNLQSVMTTVMGRTEVLIESQVSVLCQKKQIVQIFWNQTLNGFAFH